MKKFYAFILTILCVGITLAQTATGKVVDENNEPMFGVNVIEKGTTNGVTTDFDGKYSLNLTKENPVIIFRFVGYRDKEVPYNGTSISPKMEVDEIGLDAVVISASKRKERVLDAPASVSLINAEKIENTAAVSATDNLKNIPGVDVMPTGLVSQNVAVRGFNNIFSGGMLTLVDNRIGSVPSLKVNAFQLLPSSNEDIEKIEIVRGPGSALYGPNASDGVMHIITKSPLAMSADHNAETTISFTGGSRSVWAPSVRHAQKISDKVGFKISGGYMQGHDFEYSDPGEPDWGSEYYLIRTVGGNTEDTISTGNSFYRQFFIRKYNTDARIDVAINKDIDFTFSGGYTNTTNLELTGLGAAQGVNWGYAYGQARFRWKQLFFNYFINASNSGDTYMIARAEEGEEGPFKFISLLDKSKMHGIQLQHNSQIKDKWRFTYGFDALLTRPDSEGTIYGVYEDESKINQIGLYVQGEYDIHKKVTLLAAFRGDFQTPLNEFNFSPRAAVVYKPTTRHTLRLTFNRAFSTPSALNLALDLPQQFIPNGIVGKGFGNPNGFNYRRDANGLPMYISPYDGQWYEVNDNSQNYNNFVNTTQSIGAVLGEALGAGSSLGQSLMSALLDNSNGASVAPGDITDVPVVVTDFNTGKVLDLEDIKDQESVKSTITQTLELGYKGIIADKLFLTTDIYYSNIKNFTSPLTAGSYRVQFDPNSLAQVLAPVVATNLQQTTSFGGTYNELLSGQNPAFASINLDADGDGNVFREIMGLLTGDPNDPENNGYIYDFSSGTVAPDDDRVGDDLILTYLNYGTINMWGGDFGATYQHDENLSISGMFSFMNKERYKLKGDQVKGDQYVYLNSPQFRTAISVDYANIYNTGIGAGISWRWQDAFRAESAIYVGDVNAANLIDLSISYRPNFSKSTILSGNFYNIGNYKFQRFPGTPAIGFYAMFKLSHTFNYNIGKNKHTSAVE